MWDWIKGNKKIVVISVVALVIALGSVVDGCSERLRLKQAFQNTWAWINYHNQQEESWRTKDAESRKKLETAKERLAESRKAKVRNPAATSVELVELFRKEGYEAHLR